MPPEPSADEAPLAQLLQRLVQDGLAVAVAAPFLHVGEVRLVRLHLGRRGRVLLVLPGRETAAWAVPCLRCLRAGLLGEAGAGLVPVGAPVGDDDAWSGVTPLCFAHGAGADPAASDRVAACHAKSPPVLGGGEALDQAEPDDR